MKAFHRCCWLFLLLIVIGCASRVKLPDYTEFAAGRNSAIPTAVLEIYGRFSASASGKTARASFNMLVQPAKRAYLEILDPSKQQSHAFNMDTKELTLLWSKGGEYIQEPATPQNLQAITGFPVQPDDLMLLMTGYGLNFLEWKQTKALSDGWLLERPPFTAKLSLKQEISTIVIQSGGNPEVRVEYGDYEMVNDRLVPRSIRFDVPDRNISLRLEIDKFLPRDEPATDDLFNVQTPPSARRLSLKEIYAGRPLIY